MNISTSDDSRVCADFHPVLGVWSPPSQESTLSSKTYLQYKVASLKANVLIKQAMVQFHVYSASSTTLSFTINIYGDNIMLNTDCTTYSSQLLDFGSSLTVEVGSTGPSITKTEVDVRPLLQRVVGRSDWNAKRTVTFVISVKDIVGNIPSSSQVIFHDTKKCVLSVTYQDYYPSKFTINVL